MNTLRVWAVNLEVRPGNVEFNAAAIIRWIEAAGKAGDYGPDFILFPEMSLSGYLQKRKEVYGAAESVPRALNTIMDALKTADKPAVSLGYPYKKRNGPMYIRQTVIGKGRVLFNHDKTVLSPSESKIFSRGEKVESFVYSRDDIGETVCGILLCYENHFPELHAFLADRGCHVIFAPFASPREKPGEKYRRMLRFMPARAYDNSCYIISCNLIQDFINTGKSPGAAMIIDPKGKVIARRVGKREAVVKADINIDDLHTIRKSAMGYFRGAKDPSLQLSQQD